MTSPGRPEGGESAFHHDAPESGSDDHEVSEREAARAEVDRYREALHESQAVLDAFFHSSPLMMGVVEHRNGLSVGIRFNAALARFFGRDPEALVGRPAVKLGVPPEVDRLWVDLGSRCRVSGGTVREEFDLPTSGGTRRLVTFMTYLGDGPEGFPRFSFVTEDVTDLQQLDLERQRAQKLEAIGLLAGGIAHDFNNLLQGVFGYLSLARLEMSPSHPAQGLMEQAEGAIQAATALTGQLLTFARGGTPAVRPVPIAAVVERVSRFALSGGQSACRLALDADLGLVEADEGQIGQALHHVIQNASEAMAGGGTVEIEASNVTLAPGQSSSLPGGGSYVCIRVRDSGSGIPQDVQRVIFDPYFTTKTERRGLGLATVYSILRRHRGGVDVRSRPGQGSEFILYLPAQLRPAPPAVPPPVVSPDRLARCHVLVMDDEALIREVAKLMISSCGHDVTCTSDGEAALAAFQQARDAGSPFDLVILDLTVKGGMGGEETVRRLHGIDPEARVVVSSGYSDSPVIARYSDHGFLACLNKPYRMDDLRAVLLSTLGDRLAQG